MLIVLALLLLSASPAVARIPEPGIELSSDTSADGPTEADLWISKYSGTLDTTPGRTVKYYIPLGNRGPDVATGVVVSDTLPSVGGRYLLTWEWDNAYALGLIRRHSAGEKRFLRWDGELQSGDSRVLEVVLRVSSDISSCLTLSNTVSIGSSAPDPDREDNVATTFGPPVRLPDMSISKGVDGIAVPGENITYTVVYSNVGCVGAQDVVVSDVLPSLVSFVSASIPPDSIEDNTLAWRDAVVDPGALQAVTIQLVVRVRDAALTGDMLTNTVTITAALPENSPLNNIATVTTTVKRADVTMAKACPSLAIPGEQVDYVLTYANIGQALARDVRVADQLPQGATFVTATWKSAAAAAPQPVAPAPSDQGLIWSLGDVQTGATGALTITVSLAGWLDDGDVLTNHATIDSATAEDSRANNTASCSTVIQRADLWLYTTCPEPTIPGKPITYVVEFGNRGSATATGVVLTDCFPLEVDLQTVTSTVVYTAASTVDNCYAWSLADLAPEESGRIEFVAKVKDDAADGLNELIMSNVVSITTSTPESSYLNNAASCFTPVRRSDIKLAKTVNPTTIVTPGRALTFTLAYVNGGKATAEGVVVTDVLPARFTYDAAHTKPAPTRVDMDADVYTITWDIGPVAAGASGQITLTAAVSTTASWDAIIRTLTNGACITTTTPESDLSNQCSSVDVRVAPGCPARLAFMAEPDHLPADGMSETLVTITATDVFSNQVLNGTEISLRTDHGQFKPEDILPGGQSILRSTQDGVVMATLVVDQKASVARVEVQVLQPGAGCDVDRMGDVRITRVITFEGAALAVVKGVEPAEPIAPGDPVTYTVIYVNKGPGVAMQTSITDTLPISFVIDGPIQTTPEITPTYESEQVLIWSAGDLEAGANGTIVITGHFVADPDSNWQPSQAMSNCVSIGSLTDDPSFSDNATCAGDNVLIGDMWAETRAMQSEANPGGTVAWRIRIGNRGPAIARQVIVTDTLPAGTQFLRSNVSMTRTTVIGNQVIFAIGDLPSTRGMTITLLAGVSADDVVPAQLLRNHVKVWTPTYEFGFGNNEGDDPGVTVHAPDMLVRLVPAPGPVCQGTLMYYLIRYENRGNAPAEGVVITATFDTKLGCVEGSLCPRMLRYELGTVDQGGNGEIVTTWRSPQVVECITGDTRSPAPLLTSMASISTSSPEPRRVQTNNNTTAELQVNCCNFLFLVFYASGHGY
jgi:uncharacterized repeat protein (TIGR01451 family)